MNVLDLFSGIGGFSLGLERAGMTTSAFCEIEKYPRKILNKHWPDVPIFKDIRELNIEVLKNAHIQTIDVICGGFPCQPFSVAGKRRGKKDDRYLWPEMFRLIQEIRPTWVIGENVAGFVSMALDDVLSDLESKGYTCQTFIIPACAVGGIHRRDRVWIVANSNRTADGKQYEHEASSQSNDGERTIYDVANTNNCQSKRQQSNCSNLLQKQKTKRCNQALFHENDTNGSSQGTKRHSERKTEKNTMLGDLHENIRASYRPIEPPTQPTIRHRNDGLSDHVARLKALGNAVVPQIPELIGRAIMAVC